MVHLSSTFLGYVSDSGTMKMWSMTYFKSIIKIVQNQFILGAGEEVTKKY